MTTGTDLFERTISFDYGDQERNDLTRKVWAPTPWMTDAYVGSVDAKRERDMLQWCHDMFGPESSPIHNHAGQWRRGSATVYGFTWFGFATREQMKAFKARWPIPPADELTPVECRVADTLTPERCAAGEKPV